MASALVLSCAKGFRTEFCEQEPGVSFSFKQSSQEAHAIRLCDADTRPCCSLQDTVIYDRLAPNQKYEEATLIHLEEFATMGESNWFLDRDLSFLGRPPCLVLSEWTSTATYAMNVMQFEGFRE